MELKDLIPLLGNWGAMGVLLAVLLWQNNKMQTKLFDVIEKNTIAMDALKASIESLKVIIDKCQIIHRTG